jgi:hypothetical protein
MISRALPFGVLAEAVALGVLRRFPFIAPPAADTPYLWADFWDMGAGVALNGRQPNVINPPRTWSATDVEGTAAGSVRGVSASAFAEITVGSATMRIRSVLQTLTSGFQGLILRRNGTNNEWRGGYNASLTTMSIIERNAGTNTTRASVSSARTGNVDFELPLEFEVVANVLTIRRLDTGDNVSFTSSFSSANQNAGIRGNGNSRFRMVKAYQSAGNNTPKDA